ncbi:SDR family oxidoreductase [Cryptosporangium sp. NPDC048952]|uniref:SDR family oxidoreductase n=1 Tax=Cryptosporangium sp. NPDC048952 TaxID=3363961 RepID=UPI00371442CD
MSELNSRTAIVTGASRGFGRAIAESLHAAGATVVTISRTPPTPAVAARGGGGTGGIAAVVADAADERVAGTLVAEHRPRVLVLNAGAVPAMGPLHTLSWDDFSRNWQVDTRHAFVWVREALRAPLPPGSTVVTISSGAALRGSPVSGGYAGAKAAIRFLTAYAAEESERAGLGIRFATLLPQLTPTTDLGRAGVGAYAARAGVDPEAHAANMGPVLTPHVVAEAVRAVVTGAARDPEYLVTADGLRPIP